MMIKTVIAALLLTATAAYAEPPPGADPNSPTAQWYHSLKQPSNGVSCCSEADCRNVQYRQRDGHFEVFIDRKTFGFGAPDKWMVVPEDAVLHHHDNPTGEGVACYLAGRVLCFVEGIQT